MRPPDLTLKTAMRRHVERVLRMHGGDLSKACKPLGLPRRTLQRMLRRWGYRPKKSGQGRGMPLKRKRPVRRSATVRFMDAIQLVLTPKLRARRRS